MNSIYAEDKIHMIIDYWNENNKLPPHSYEENDIKLGNFLSGLINGNNKECFEYVINKPIHENFKKFWNDKINDMIQKRKERVIIPPKIKLNMLYEYWNKNRKLPTQKYIDQESGIKLGRFMDELKSGNNKKLLESFLDQPEHLEFKNFWIDGMKNRKQNK